jgi:hypothetical protein
VAGVEMVAKKKRRYTVQAGGGAGQTWRRWECAGSEEARNAPELRQSIGERSNPQR